MTDSLQTQEQELDSTPNRYCFLSVLIGVFLLLVVLLSGVTFYATYQWEKSAQQLKLIAQQGVIIQRLSKNVLDINLSLDEAMQSDPLLGNVVQIEKLPKYTWSRLNDTEKQKIFFESVIDALKNGGVVTAPNGERFEVAPIQDETLLQELQKLQTAWMPYAKLLEKLHQNAQKNVISRQDVQALVEYVRPHDEALQIQVNGMATDLYRLTQVHTTYLRYIQIGGVGIASLLFLLIIFGVLRRLAKKDVLLEAARHETYEIMRTVDTGLFLLDRDLVIGNQHSEVLEDILGTDKLAGESLSAVLHNRVSEKDLKTAEEFLEQLYRPHVKEKLVKSLNPLHKVRFQDPKRPTDSRYLDFRFSRVYENGEIVNILVNVSDVSEAVRLEQRLKKERADNDMRIEMLTSILNTSPKVINEFIQTIYVHIDKMNAMLRKPGSSQFELENKLMSIYREMHNLKGEASALRLHSFTKIATEAEDKLYAMQNQGKLLGNDFLPLAVYLDDLFRLANTISNLGERMNAVLDEADIAALQAKGRSDDVADTEQAKKSGFVSLDQMTTQVEVNVALGDFLVSFAQDIAKRQGKSVKVDISQMQGKHIPDRLSVVVKEIYIQLLRNAIVHGIADSQTRVQQGKLPTGVIKLSLLNGAGEQKDSLVLAVEDDGQGIDYDAIRDKLCQNNTYPADKVKELTEAQLLNALFSSGFSTKAVADEDGGRGVGLDLVKARVKEFGGKINVQSKVGCYARFIIKLPLL